MFGNARELIIHLFNKIMGISDTDTRANNSYAKAYEDISDINFNAIFSNKLAGFVTTESNIDVVNADDNPEKTKRVGLLDQLVEEMWGQSRKITSRMLGTGGVVLIPYVVDGCIYTDIVSQNRFFINRTLGNQVTQACVLADQTTIDKKKYYRWVYYELHNTIYTITNKVSDDKGAVSPETVPEWSTIAPVISIGNVTQMLFAYLKCPIDKRSCDDLYGVPITYGNEKLLKQIKDHISYLASEYELKKPFVGASEMLFDKYNNLPKNGLFKKLESDNDDFWAVFDPAIRDTSLIAGLNIWFELLEKSIGTSRGILTQPNTSGATATEIKRSSYDTFALIENIRSVWEHGINDLVYAFDVLTEHYGITPKSDYKVKFDWSYALVESSQETFSQLTQAQSIGAVSKAEMRQFVKPSETLEEAQDKVDEILQNEPPLNILVGD